MFADLVNDSDDDPDRLLAAPGGGVTKKVQLAAYPEPLRVRFAFSRIRLNSAGIHAGDGADARFEWDCELPGAPEKQRIK